MNNFLVCKVVFIVSFILMIVCICAHIYIRLILRTFPCEEILLKIHDNLLFSSFFILLYHCIVIIFIVFYSAAIESTEILPLSVLCYLMYIISFSSLECLRLKIKKILNVRTSLEDTHDNSNPLHPLINA